MSRLHDPKHIKYVKKHYADTCSKKIAKKLGLGVHQVYNIALRFGLKKSEAYHKAGLSGRIERGKALGKQYQYPKGHVPFNKGKKMPVVGRMAETQFKKGNLPHNAKFDGYERVNVEGYIEVRVSRGKFKLKQRLVWETINGEIPKGMCVVFKDGNKLNCDIENLEIITRAENMKRNTIHRYSEEIKPIVRLIGKLKKKVHEKQNRRPKKPSVCPA